MVAHKTRRKLNYLDKLVERVYRKILNKIIRFINGEPIRVVNTYDALDEIKTFISSQSGNNIKTIITNRIR